MMHGTMNLKKKKFQSVSQCKYITDRNEVHYEIIKRIHSWNARYMTHTHTHTHTHTQTNFKVLKAYNNNCEQLRMLRHRDIREMKSRQCWTTKKLNSYRILLAKRERNHMLLRAIGPGDRWTDNRDY